MAFPFSCRGPLASIRGPPPDGLGEYSSPVFNPANPLILNILIQTTPTLHSAGVLFLDQSPFYRHYAPLERKAIPSSPFPSSGALMYLVVPPFYRHYAPLERKAIPLPRFPPLGL